MGKLDRLNEVVSRLGQEATPSRLQGVNVLSAFDGIGAARAALNQAGVPVGRYYASEIDPYAAAAARGSAVDDLLGRLAAIRRMPPAGRAGAPGGPAMWNEIHLRPAIQFGSPRAVDHVTEPGFVYRTLLEPELEDAARTGFFLPRPGGRSAGGRVNTKHWVQGGAGAPAQYFRFDMGKHVIRVPSGLVRPREPVRLEDVFLGDPRVPEGHPWRWLPLPTP